MGIERLLKWMLLINIFITVYSWWYYNELPTPNYYQNKFIKPPIQTKITQPSFEIAAENHRYQVTPLYDYQLEGIVVTFSNAEQFGNIWHHKRWKDFINLRDLCVIWGSNVTSGIYKNLLFSSDSWTCWVNADSYSTWQKFNGEALSNNHLLTDSDDIKEKLMQAEIGDLISLKGQLVKYTNLVNGYKRSTSITRSDKGQGACETIYLTSFEILKKANPTIRKAFHIFSVLTIINLISLIIAMALTPKYSRRAK